VPEMAKEEMARRIRGEENRLYRLQKDLEGDEAKLVKLRSSIERKKSMIRDATDSMETLEERKTAKARLPAVVLRERKLLVEKIKLVESGDITVRMKSSLESEIERQKKQLRDICPHTFILDYDGYGGSHAYDYEDAHYGTRLCIICGHFEYSKSTTEDEFALLFDDPSRLIKRDLRDKDQRIELMDSIWIQLPFYRKVFANSAGLMNAKFPE